MSGNNWFTLQDQSRHSTLLARVIIGDEMAFRELYFLWQPVLSSFILKITKSKEMTAEIVQDIFMKVWQNRESLASVENFKSYLFVLSKNHAINCLRKSLKKDTLIKCADNIQAVEKEETSSTDWQYELLDRAIDQLSPRQKQIYLLHRHERLSYKQIAEKLGIGKESVKTHLSLAIRSIKKNILLHLSQFLILINLFF